MVVEVNSNKFIIFNNMVSSGIVVNSGRTSNAVATRVTLDKGRAPLQTITVERLGSQSPSDQIPVWLFVIDPGHLRVFSQQEIASMVDLEAFTSADVFALETREERERLGALRMRIISSTIVPERRLKIPSDAFDICGEYLDRTHVWLDQSSSRLDVYTATYVQRALALPPSRFLPATFDSK